MRSRPFGRLYCPTSCEPLGWSGDREVRAKVDRGAERRVWHVFGNVHRPPTDALDDADEVLSPGIIAGSVVMGDMATRQGTVEAEAFVPARVQRSTVAVNRRRCRLQQCSRLC
jgi:hypothetical protein